MMIFLKIPKRKYILEIANPNWVAISIIVSCVIPSPYFELTIITKEEIAKIAAFTVAANSDGFSELDKLPNLLLIMFLI